jgi:hypothetical protein
MICGARLGSRRRSFGSSSPKDQTNEPSRTFGELLIDLEEDKVARAAVFGLLWEVERR